MELKTEKGMKKIKNTEIENVEGKNEEKGRLPMRGAPEATALYISD